MFLAPNGGAVEGWQTAFVLGVIVVLIMTFTGLRMLFLNSTMRSYQWRASRSLKLLIVALPVLIGLIVWYRVDSHDLWVARADAQTGAEYLIEALGEDQVLNVNPNDVPIPFTSGIPGRPRRNTETCQQHPFFGTVDVFTPAPERLQALLDERQFTLEEREAALQRRKPPLEEIEAKLAAKGWETNLTVDAETGRVSLASFREDKSLTFAASLAPSDPTTDAVRVTANFACRDD